MPELELLVKFFPPRSDFTSVRLNLAFACMRYSVLGIPDRPKRAGPPKHDP